jgi:hypothetical protein
MMRRRWTDTLLLGAALLPALLATGCVVRQQQPAVMAPQPQAANAAFVVENRSAESICYVNISATSDSAWGPDRLGSSETIPPGTDRGWTMPVGYYDFRFLDCNQQTMMERRSVGVGDTGVTVTFRVRE